MANPALNTALWMPLALALAVGTLGPAGAAAQVVEAGEAASGGPTDAVWYVGATAYRGTLPWAPSCHSPGPDDEVQHVRWREPEVKRQGPTRFLETELRIGMEIAVSQFVD